MRRLARHILLLFFLALAAYPLIWMTLAAFRKDGDIIEHPFRLPEGFRWANLAAVFAQGGFRSAGANAWMLLGVLMLAALLFWWMTDMLQFRFRWRHLAVYAALGGVWAACAQIPAFGRAMRSAGFVTAYFNSVLLCVCGVTAAIMLSELAAFAFAKIQFQGRKWLYLLFLLGMMIPVHVTLIPLNLFLGPGYLNLKGSLFALAGPYIGFALPVSILILRGAFAEIPDDLVDAARIDGCSPWQIFRHVALPLAKPAISTVLIFNFLAMWNEYAFALTLGSSRKPTLPIALNDFRGEQGSLDMGVICAALLVAVAPLLIVYFFAQRQIIKGLTAGAVKE